MFFSLAKHIKVYVGFSQNNVNECIIYILMKINRETPVVIVGSYVCIGSFLRYPKNLRAARVQWNPCAHHIGINRDVSLMYYMGI